MGQPLDLHDATGVIVKVPGLGILFAHGSAKPTDGDEGYANGCLFIVVGGGDGASFFVNDGDIDSADFNLVTVASA